MPARKSGARMARDIVEFLHATPAGATRSARDRRPWPGSTIQSLLFDVDAWTAGQARRWAASHGYRGDKIHVTRTYVRIRQHAPRPGKPKRIIPFGDGIRAIVEST
jgi:hypothetical protein